MKTISSALIIFSILISNTVFAQWSPSIKLSTQATYALLNENMASCLAASGDTVHVVWSDKRTNGHAIYYERSKDAGQTWDAAIPITDTTGSAFFPAIAVSGLTVHVVWLDTSLGVSASFYKRSLDGGNTWGSAYCLDSNTKFWPGLSSSGSTVVVSLNKEVAVGNTEVFFRRSMDNGTSWDAEQQISNATGRSEDPAIAILDNNIHLSWNDKRSGIMQIYYRHSADAGLSWGPETQLTDAVSPNSCYTSMVSLDRNYTDVPYGYSFSNNFDVWLKQSSDTGATWITNTQITNDALGEAYPFMVRDSMNLHIVYVEFGSKAWYVHSGDGGATWDSAVFLGNGFQPYIAITGCTLHVIYPDSGSIYYRQNPTGNCEIATGINESSHSNTSGNTLSIFQDQFSQIITFEFTVAEDAKSTLKIHDMQGREVAAFIDDDRRTGEMHQIKFNTSKLSAGLYLCKLHVRNSVLTKKFVVLK